MAKVNIKDMEKLIALKLKEQPDIDRQQDGGYITWDDDGRPVLHFTNLVNDIIKDLHVHVVTGTKKDIALYKNDFNTLRKQNKITLTNNYEGECGIEVWKYNPINLDNGKYVDPLSLISSFRDNQDERVTSELNILNESLW